MQINILEGSWLCTLVLMGRVSVTISYSFRCLTTETVKYTNENSFIESLASSKYSYVGKDRETNVIINVHFACSEEELPCVQKCKQVCVNCSVQRKRSNMNLVFIFSCV